jgi:hypothetical protein
MVRRYAGRHTVRKLPVKGLLLPGCSLTFGCTDTGGASGRRAGPDASAARFAISKTRGSACRLQDTIVQRGLHEQSYVVLAPLSLIVACCPSHFSLPLFHASSPHISVPFVLAFLIVRWSRRKI